MRAAELFVKCLENEGVKYLFGVPGEEELEILEHLQKSSIQYIPTRHEQGAAFMADIVGRLTGKPGVCMATLGPGALNLVTGVADATLDHAPLVAITGQIEMHRQHKESHQFIDIVTAFKPLTKWNASITRPDTVPEVVRKAFKIATMEKPGATHIEFPEDVQLETPSDVQKPLEIRPLRRPAPDYKALAQAVALLNASKSPLILAGNGALRKLASKQLRLFVEATGIPVVSTFMGKGAIPEDSPHFLGSLGLKTSRHRAQGFESFDTVIVVGYDLVEYDSYFWNPHNDKKIIHIDFTPAEIDGHYYPDVEIIADISYTLWALNEELRLGNIHLKLPNKKIIGDLHKSYRDSLEKFKDDTTFPLKPQKIVWDMRQALGNNDLLISDVGVHKVWIGSLYPAREPSTVIMSNGLATMGIGLPGGIAAKLIAPEKKVLVATGDGGFLMNLQELETACRLKLPLVILIWRDNGYGAIALHQMKRYGATFGVGFTNPNFETLAQSFGAECIRIKKASDLASALKKAFAVKDKPVLIDCPVDYSGNVDLTKSIGTLIGPA